MKNKKNNKPLICAVLLAHLFFATIFMLQAQELLSPEGYTSIATPPVGAIPGEIDVSPMGAATYTIPIEVVPGTQGVQPNLSIVYNSLSGMGILGMKWSLAGLSAISRCGQTPYYDNKIEAIQLNLNDRFALDGARLLQMCDGTYGGNEVQYATEVETFSRIVSYGGGRTGPPDYFKAFADDGTIIEYGFANNSKQQLDSSDPLTTLNWFVNKITDVNGNYMTFYYEQEDGEIRINEIRYTVNPKSTFTQPYAKVKFDYDTTSLLIQNTCFIGGFPLPSQTKFLQTITVSYKDTVVRKYEFKYNTNEQNERTLHLNEIILKGADNTQLIATTISWGENYSAIVPPQAISGLPANFPTGKILPGDFNGDGYTDFVVYDVASSGKDKIWYLYLFNHSNKLYEQKSWNTYTPEYDDALFFAQNYTGDGKDNLIIGIKKYNTSQYIYYHEFNTYSPDINSNIVLTYKIYDYNGITFGDFNGDGITDIMFVSVTIETPVGKRWTAHWNLSCYSTHFNETASAICFDSDYTYKAVPDIQIVNVSGNGKSAIRVEYIDTNVKRKNVIYELAESGFVGEKYDLYGPFYYSPDVSFYGDVNGDGFKDILVAHPCAPTPHWELFIAKGDRTYIQNDLGSVLDPSWLGNQDCNKVNQVRFVDLNGDGKEDIIQGVGLRKSFNILLSKKCENEQYQYTPITLNNISGNHSSIENWTIGDVNGDGLPDIILLDNEDLTLPIRYISFNQDNDYEFVKEITDGMGKTIQLSYKHKYLTAKSVHQDTWYANLTTTTAQRNFLPTVDSVRVSNGIGDDFNTLKYKFSTLVYSLPRRSLLGFNEFVCIRVQENKRDSLAFNFYRYYDNFNQILLPNEKISFVGNTKTNIINYPLSVCDLENFTRFIYKSDITEYNYLTNTFSETKNTLNNQGRIITSSSGTYEGASATPAKRLVLETKEYFYKGICFQDPCQHKTVPKTIISTQQYGNGPTITDTTTYTYGNLGRLASVRQANKDGAITTSYNNYLVSGMCKEKTVSAANLSRKETCDYDQTSRFTTSIKNDLDHETKIYYDAKTGNKTKEVDPNGLTTEYKYDVFGNLTKVTCPDGTETNTAVHWYSNSYLPSAKYQIITTGDGKPAVRVYYDLFGREVCRLENGNYYETQYNNRGQMVRTSLPFGAFNNNRIWHEYTYDDYGRKTSETAQYTDLIYSYSTRKVTITDKLRKNIESYNNYDALGRIVEAKDEGGIITYKYDIITKDNKERHRTKISVSGSDTTTIITDLRGNRLSITDPDAGTITSEYNKLNELVKQTDANGNITTYLYDTLGRVIQKYFSGSNLSPQTIKYTYDYLDAINKLKGKLYLIRVNNKIEETFRYDELGRLQRHDKIANGSNTYLYTYNSNGQMETFSYPDGFEVTYSYTTDGKLSEIRRSDDNSNSLIYKVHARNLYNQPVKCEYGNEVVTENEYNTLGLITRIKTGNKNKLSHHGGESKGSELVYKVDSTILNYRYDYDNKGLMSSRSESVVKRLEMYEYDVLDRLIGVTVGSIGQTGTVQEFEYYKNGNIKNNSKIGVYTYGTTMSPPKPHAVTLIEQTTNAISANQCDVTYNYFNQPTKITEGEYQIEIDYGANQQRNKMTLQKEGKQQYVQYYIDKRYEETVNYNTSTLRNYDFIYGDNGVVALHIFSRFPKSGMTNPPNDSTIFTEEEDNIKGVGTSDSMYYIHTDHLGSYCVITNANKKIVQHNYFDPWGNTLTLFRGISPPPEQPQLQPSINFALCSRGFTGHEHYPYFKIINMNGRLYDPVIGRFFSPDKYVANSSFTQDFNRYTYARNCPLMYTDPDGNFPWLLPLIAGAWMGMMQGALMGSVAEATGLQMFGYIAGGMSIGGAAGLISAGVGSAVAASLGGLGAGVGFLSGMAAGTVGGALNGFGMGLLGGQGGSDLWKSVWQGALIGAGTGAVMGALTGGIDAKAMGGNFWSGDGARAELLAPQTKGNTVTVGNDMEYSNEYAKKFLDERFGTNIKAPKNLYADGTLAPGYTADGDLALNPNGRSVLGVTTCSRASKMCDMYLYKAAFTSKELLYFTMGHELGHVHFFSLGNRDVDFHHHVIDAVWAKAQAQFFSYSYDYFNMPYENVSLRSYYNYDFPFKPKLIYFGR